MAWVKGEVPWEIGLLESSNMKEAAAEAVEAMAVAPTGRGWLCVPS